MTDYLEYYFMQHYERIKLTIELLKDFVKPESMILDLGSIFPLSTYWFYLQKAVKVICADLCPKIWKVSDKLYSAQVDLNNSMLHTALYEGNGKKTDGWELINFQEVIEHLTCDLEEARNRIMDALRPGGYLLAGYPLISVNVGLGSMPAGSNLVFTLNEGMQKRPSFNTIMSDEGTVPSDHKREFLLEECVPFFPLKVLTSKVVFTLGYTRGTVLVLYQKER